MADKNLIEFAEYRTKIKSIAADIRTRMDEEPEDCGTVDEEIRDVVEWHQWHINYGYPLWVLIHTDTDPDNWQIYVGDDADHHAHIRAMAYVALIEDITDEFRRQEVPA